MLGKAIANKMQVDVTIFNFHQKLKHHLGPSRASVILSGKSLPEQEERI